MSVSFEIAIQPPARARRDAVLNPPLVLLTRVTDVVNGFHESQTEIWAFITLVDRNGEVVSGSLRGNLAESAHPLSNSDDSTGYLIFENLSIHSIGSYRLRITLMRMESGSGAATLQQAETRLIVVAEEDVRDQPPSASEQELLDLLPN